jgi:tetratricopeptide (TPR) repeat protein
MEPETIMNDRATRIYGLSVFVISAIVYAMTCCQTVFVGDSGELTLALINGGIAHPPGYPLYTILGYLWLKVFFFLRPALAANLFSAASAAATSAFLFLLLRRLTSRQISSIIPAALSLLYAFSFPVWSSATNAEVYALSGLLYISAFYVVIRFYQDGGERSLTAAAFLCGLTLTHHFSAGVIIAVLVMAIFYRRSNQSTRSFIPALIVFLLPMTLYVYLLVRFDPALPINWMAEKSMVSLWSLVSGEIYRQFVGWPMPGDLILFARKTLVASLMYAGPGLIIMVLPGLVIGFRKKSALTLMILIPAVLNLLMVSTYHIPDYEGFLIPSLISAIVLIFFFLNWVWSRYKPGKVVGIVVAGLLILPPLVTNYSRCDLSRFTLAEHYAEDLLDSAADNSLLFLKSDNGSHAALYLNQAENYRPDLRVYSTNSTLTRLKKRYGNKSFAEIMTDLEAGTERIFWGTEYIINQGMNPTTSQKSLRGLLYGRLGDDDDTDVYERISDYTRDDLPGIDLKGDLKAQHIYLEYQLHRLDRLIMGGMSPAVLQYLYDLHSWGSRLDDPMTCLAIAQFFRTRGLIDWSLKWIDMAVALDPYSYQQRDIHVNLGAIYRQAGDLGKAGQALSQALRIDPDYPPARYNAYLIRAEIALQQQNLEEALEAFRVLTGIEPNNPLPYFNMAVIYERLPGRAAHALDYYKMFLARAGQENDRAITRARERIEALESSPGQNE